MMWWGGGSVKGYVGFDNVYGLEFGGKSAVP